MVSNEHKISTGRGGAGNIGSPKLAPKPDESLETPTLKASKYTTGRGGAGNMARFEKNDPNEARVAQDVTAQPRHEDPHAPVAVGRGGSGNIVKPDGSDSRASSRSKRSNSGVSNGSQGSRRRRSSSLADKGREMLHKVRDASAARKAAS